MAAIVDRVVAPYYQQVQSTVVPFVRNVVHQLDIPSWDVYYPAVLKSCHDVSQATRSTATLVYISLKPWIILLLLIAKWFGQLCHLLFQLLLEQGWISATKGLKQAKVGISWIIEFHRGLTRTQLLGEVCLVGLIVLAYQLRQWLKRQTYVARATKYYRQQKRKFIQSYTKAVNQVAQVSLILAMAVPHAAFAGAMIALKLFVPSLLTWLASDTFLTVLLSVVYPLFSSIYLIHNKRHPEERSGDEAATTAASVQELKNKFEGPSSSSRTTTNSSSLSTTSSSKSPTKSNSKSSSRPSYMTATSTSSQRSNKPKDRTSKRRDNKSTSSPSTTTTSGVFPRTTPKSSTKSTTTAATKQPSHAVSLQQDPADYWLRYWIVFATVQATTRILNGIPILGRFFMRHPLMLSLGTELKLVFFLWVFGMEQIVGNSMVMASSSPGGGVEQQHSVLADALPLQLMSRHVSSILIEFQAVVSESVSAQSWETYVVSKADKIMDLLVMLRIISKDTKDMLKHVLVESRSLVLPSITLFMPGFVTQFGVTYDQYIVPSAKSSIATSAASDLSKVFYLQYWVLHCGIAAVLQWLSGLLWWIPFSTHAIYLLWCHLSFLPTVDKWYAIVEEELIAFGLVRRPDNLVVPDTLQETKTVRFFSNIFARLPSAADHNDDDTPESTEHMHKTHVNQEVKDASLNKVSGAEESDSSSKVKAKGREGATKSLRVNDDDDGDGDDSSDYSPSDDDENSSTKNNTPAAASRRPSRSTQRSPTREEEIATNKLYAI